MRPLRLLASALALFLLLAPAACTPDDARDASNPDAAAEGDVARWEATAERVEIIRDEWGVPHVYAPTDADAVFGLMYAQAEDDFPRIEVNFLTALGRRAEAEGEARLWQDLRQRLFIDPVELQAMYDESPQWLRDLMDGWADGLNYFLHTHPEVEPQVLTRFEPWMALSFSEGSIGGDIERVRLGSLEEFYDDAAARPQPLERAASARILPAPGEAVRVAAVAGAGTGWRGAAPSWTSGLATPDPYLEPVGSNGIAISPQNTAAGNALLLINPHTSFFFRHEAHVVSDEGLNAYGALTWGQFFVYQGFNETAGWMHTSSSVDNIDEFAEVVVEGPDGGLVYRYGDEERPVEEEAITIRIREDDDTFSERTFTTYRTHHGPIVRATDDGRWVAVAMMEEPMRALIQSYNRTKAANLDEYLEVMEAHTNSSNNTLFADAEGNAAYLHSNFVPVRDDRFDYSRPVDGSDPASDWQGLHTIEESPNTINPSTGFAFCTNNWPYSAGGGDSPDRDAFPDYMDRGSENSRGVHALELLPGRTDLTLDGLQELAYDSRLPWFDEPIPALVSAHASLSDDDPRKEALAPMVEALEGWDRRWGVDSEETALAVFWGTELRRLDDDVTDPLLTALEVAAARLEEDFGSWRTPWGEINRFQRVTGDIVQPFDDALPSTPVGFTSARWGSLASFGARPYPETDRWYGTSGNSFVAVVEFGERVRARAVTAGGLNNDPDSPHFNDQAERYATGDLRPVHFHRDEVEAAAQRTYRPGER